MFTIVIVIVLYLKFTFINFINSMNFCLTCLYHVNKILLLKMIISFYCFIP